MNQSKEQLETQLSDYVDGNLADDQLASIEAYLEANPGVRDAVNRLMIDSEALRSLPRVNAPYDFSEDVRGQLERDLLLDDSSSAFPRRRRVSSLLATVAAMLVLFLGLGGAAYWILANRPAPFPDIASNIPAPVGESVTAAREAEQDDEASARELGAAAAKPEGDVAAIHPASKSATADGGAGPETFADRKTTEIAKASVRVEGAEAVPPDVSELIVDSPRYNRLARAIVIESADALPAKETVDLFLARHGVRAETLAYDATRNRALSRKSEPLADAALQITPETQVSGVVTNVAPNPTAQAIETSRLQSNVPEPQVMLAIGLTEDQAAALQQSLQEQLGEPRVLAYQVDERLRSLQPGRAEVIGSGLAAGTFERTNREAADQPQTVAPATQPMLVSVGDQLAITLIDPDASNLKTRRELTVDADGKIELPMLEPIPASGMTIGELQKFIADRYIEQKLMRQPVVEIEVPGRFTVTSVPDQQGTTPVPPEEAQRDLDSRQKDKENAELIDVYLVVRGQRLQYGPTTVPVELVPTTQPQ